jgi:eukaryotic-like serine/threonine-protein kinase
VTGSPQDRPENGTGGGEPRYRLDARIATGGMGEVWRATDVVLGREVAVKLLKAEYADDPSFRSRFQTEARNAAALHHPNVAAIFDFGERSDDGDPPRPYLVMELVPGEPLSNLLRGGQPMPPDTAAHLLAQAADGLAAAHDLGIVHRDIKPANLLITPDRTVKITDFGIARAADAVALTRTGQVLGTPQYLSPEQAEGRPATFSSDIYSLGVVLYECLAGRRPFTGDSPVAIALAHLRQDPPPLSEDVPAPLRRAVETALAKDPSRRFGSVRDFAAALRGRPVPGASVPGTDDQPTRVERAVPPVAAVGGLASAVPEPDGLRDTRTTPVQVSGDAGPDGRGPDGPRRGGLPGWWPWLLVALVLVAAGVVALFWLTGNPGGSGPGPTKPSGQASPTGQATHRASRTPSPSSTPSPTPEQVEVQAADYVGRPAAAVRGDLESLGLRVAQRTVDNPGDQETGTVADLTPTGLLDKGTTVTMSVYRAAPSPTSTPSSTPSSTGSPSTSPSSSPSTSSSPSSSTSGSGGPGNGGGNGQGNGQGNGHGQGNGNGNGNAAAAAGTGAGRR